MSKIRSSGPSFKVPHKSHSKNENSKSPKHQSLDHRAKQRSEGQIMEQEVLTWKQTKHGTK
jgi:hypothetical protein